MGLPIKEEKKFLAMFNTFRNFTMSLNQTETDVSCPNNNKVNDRQRNEFKANERLNTTYATEQTEGRN